VFPSGVSGNPDRHTWQRAGHFTHAVTADNDHTDPGLIDRKRLFAAGHKDHPGPHPSQTHVYVVEQGDMLFSIATSQLGDGARWPEIYDLNKSIIGNNPALIVSGQQLTIPAA
jgi:nucleoid-associated protein YgaU